MAKKTPQFLILAGFILLMLAGSLKVSSLWEDYLAGHQAQLVLEQMRRLPSSDSQPPDPASVEFADKVKNAPALNQTDSPKDFIEPEPDYEMESYQVPDPSGASMTMEQAGSDHNKTSATSIPKYDTLGVLTISKFELELPILSECTDSLLKVSVCRYQGDTQEKPERLVVAGHNYKSHFGKLPNLVLGDGLCFTSLDGAKYYYTVTEIMVISKDDHETLCQGEWDITLFTCNFDGSKRILVRCQEYLSFN